MSSNDVVTPAIEAPAATRTARKAGAGKTRVKVDDAFVAEVCKRLNDGQRVRRVLPDGGRLHIDRQLPFLCVYRRPDAGVDDGTEALLVGEAAYLIASDKRAAHKNLTKLVTAIGTSMAEAFGAFLLFEIWASPRGADTLPEHKPTFRILTPPDSILGDTVQVFERALQVVKIQDQLADIATASAAKCHPPGVPPLITRRAAAELNIHLMGMEIRPVYRDQNDGEVFPLILRDLRKRFSRACKRGIFGFLQQHTTHQPDHYHSIGSRALVKAVWRADEQLAAVSNTFDLLLSVTPTNTAAAWKAFKRGKCQRTPLFSYRALSIDPALLKRQLYKIRIETIEDPTMTDLLSDQQLDMDRQISLLAARNTRNFLYGSLQLFGSVDDGLHKIANEILERLPGHNREESSVGAVDAAGFAARATEELDYLRLTHPGIDTKIQVRDDVIGLMVSRGNLLIGADTKVPAARVRALLAHEVGTHVTTYLNARTQPFKQLYVGLPGYEELQEGLAVLAEYLVGGLNRPRLRLLAARVIAARCLIDGATFVDVFRELDERYAFTQRTAFNITTRIFRGGGLTKDATYLRGLVRLLEHIKGSGHFESLFVGKFGLKHIPIVQELQLRRVLGPPRLRPSYLDDPEALARLDRVRAGLTVFDLVE